jgi:hypothetical protein
MYPGQKSSLSVTSASTAAAAPRTMHASVVVIGGGLAGLAATSRLASWFATTSTMNRRTSDNGNGDQGNNYSDVVLLEAASRLGGRVHSVFLPAKQNLKAAIEHDDLSSSSLADTVVDLGATWFHGTQGNVAYDLAAANGMVDHDPTDVDDVDDDDYDYGIELYSNDGVYVTKNGERHILPAAEGTRIAQLYTEAFEQGTKSNRDDLKSESCWEYIKEYCGYDQQDHDPSSIRDRAILRSRDRFECCIVGCDGGSTYDFSLLDKFEWLPGDDVLPSNGQQGMSGLVEILRRQISAANQSGNANAARILCDTEVNQIDWSVSSKDGTTVELLTTNPRDKTNPHVVIRASMAIWTPSLNVTRRAVENQMFSPPLPESKINALHRRGQGQLEKVVVFLQKPLHDVIPNVRIPVAWEEDGEECIIDSSIVKDDDTHHWKTSIFGLTYDPDYQNTNQYIVWFWLVGSAGPKLNAMSEDLRKQEVEAVLSFLYAQTVHVSHVLLSNWTGNPYVLGSFSYDRALGSTDDSSETTSSTEVLAEPLPSPENPILCFAGEATHPKYYSTMHGAMETGYREADRCIASLKGN